MDNEAIKKAVSKSKTHDFRINVAPWDKMFLEKSFCKRLQPERQNMLKSSKTLYPQKIKAPMSHPLQKP